MFVVYWDGKRASKEGYPELKGEGWEDSSFYRFEDAVQYGNDWLDFGQELPIDVQADTKYTFGDSVMEIRNEHLDKGFCLPPVLR